MNRNMEPLYRQSIAPVIAAVLDNEIDANFREEGPVIRLEFL